MQKSRLEALKAEFEHKTSGEEEDDFNAEVRRLRRRRLLQSCCGTSMLGLVATWCSSICKLTPF